MKDFLKKFQTTVNYNTWKSSENYIEPHVGWITENGGSVEYKEKTNYAKLYLTFEAIEDTTFTFSQNALQYSLDNGSTWTTLAPNTASPTVTVGNKIMWKQTGLIPSSSSTPRYGIGRFSATGNFKAYGNVMSLYYGDNFISQKSLSGKNYAFRGLFATNDKLINAFNLILPATTLASYCYEYMFESCTALTAAPELPATTLANYCYSGMFKDCTSLTTAPELLATTLPYRCYSSMFYGCTALTTAPELPATTLNQECYISMFKGCTSLTTAPELPATTLVMSSDGCYAYMFDGCTSLNYIKCLATENINNKWSGGYSATTGNWTNNVSQTGIFIKDPNASWPTSINGIPSGWTVYNYNDSRISINKTNVIIADNYNLHTYTLPILSNQLNVPITYSSSNPSIISINSSTGTITLNNYGTVTISIIFDGNNDYVSKTLTYNIQYCEEMPYDGRYLTFEAIEDTTFTFSTNALQYSLDNGSTWATLAANTSSPTIIAGNKIIWKQTGLTPTSSAGIGKFTATGNFKVYGNIMSLYYDDNFINQINLTNKNYAFYNLFKNNTYLVDAANLILPATTLADYCYSYMFSGCTSLTSTPELPATTLAQRCYQYMFQGCTLLTTAPELHATTLTLECYYYMFYGCTSLNYIKCLATDISIIGCTNGWIYNVAATGTFIKASSVDWSSKTGTNGIPSGWTVYNDGEAKLYINKSALYIVKDYNTNNYELPTLSNPENLPIIYSSSDSSIISINSSTGIITLNDYGTVTISISFAGNETYEAKTLTYDIEYYETMPYKMQYLTFEAVENTTFKFSRIAMQYSLDNGNTWITLTANTASPTITAGNKIIFKQSQYLPSNSSSAGYGYGTVTATGNFKVYGNAMSLLLGDNFAESNTNYTMVNTYLFYGLFKNNTYLVDASNLILPASTLAENCYQQMFYGCTSLTVVPQLHATTLAGSCYQQMFFGCTALTTAPTLTATTLAANCYQQMFQDCTSLTTAPELPATTLAYSCYIGMFNSCTALTTIPELPATTLANYCYQYMFQGCTSLAIAPELSATTLSQYCYEGMFKDCTALTTAPELPATTLANYCYSRMFQGCTSLTTAPELPATTLANYCYQYMFNGCTSLNYIKCLATDIYASNCTKNWVSGVAATGTFVKNASMTSWGTGTAGIPSGWAVQNAA